MEVHIVLTGGDVGTCEVDNEDSVEFLTRVMEFIVGRTREEQMGLLGGDDEDCAEDCCCDGGCRICADGTCRVDDFRRAAIVRDMEAMGLDE